MKIALISAANNIHTIRWANALAERQHDVTVFCCKDHLMNIQSSYHAAVRIVGLQYSSPFGYYLNARCLMRYIAKEQFDVVNIHYASGYGTLGRRAKLRGALLNIWGSDVYIYPYKNRFSSRTIKKNLAFYKYVASTSNCMAQQAKKFVDREYFITPFGVDTELFKPIDEIKSTDKIIIGTVKTLSPIYGIADSIKAFNEVLQKLQNEEKYDMVNKICFEIYGKGQQHEELLHLINDLGLQDKITLCGYVENVKLPSIYNRFNIFVCNSLSESFGVAAVEAMACGIPVQVSDAEGFAEVVENGVTGLITPKGNIGKIAENMYTLLLDKEMRDKMSQAGVERAKRLYDWNDCVDNMIEIYREMTND